MEVMSAWVVYGTYGTPAVRCPVYATMPAMSTSMPAMSARPAAPMGYYGQGGQFPFVPNPGWLTEEQLLQQQQLLREKQEFDAWRASQPKLTFSLSPR